jgi:hypothetical protein
VEVNDGLVPMCKGDDALGAPCDDYNDCSVNDMCINVTNPTPIIGNVACRGMASGLPCEDYNDCTDNDICIDIPTTNRVFGRNILCRGDVAVGRPCDDGRDYSVDTVCSIGSLGFAVCDN